MGGVAADGAVRVSSIPSALIGTIGRFKTTSALALLLVAGLFFGLFACAVTAWTGADHPLTWTLWSFVMVWFLGIGGAYIYWSIKDPDRLQTEDYQLEQRRINLLGDERHPGKVIEAAPLTANTTIGVSR
jgi:hypothetical protein